MKRLLTAIFITDFNARTIGILLHSVIPKDDDMNASSQACSQKWGFLRYQENDWEMYMHKFTLTKRLLKIISNLFLKIQI